MCDATSSHGAAADVLLAVRGRRDSAGRHGGDGPHRPGPGTARICSRCVAISPSRPSSALSWRVLIGRIRANGTQMPALGSRRQHQNLRICRHSARSSVDRALASGARGRKFESCRARSRPPCKPAVFTLRGLRGSSAPGPHSLLSSPPSAITPASAKCYRAIGLDGAPAHDSRDGPDRATTGCASADASRCATRLLHPGNIPQDLAAPRRRRTCF